MLHLLSDTCWLSLLHVNLLFEETHLFGKRMHTVSIANQKGGVGKTTTSVNLGASLASLGYQVLLIDMDAQGSLTSWLGAPNEVGKGIYSFFEKQTTLSNLVRKTEIDNLSLVPSSPWLARLERMLLLSDDPGISISPYEILREGLHSLQDAFQYCLIDCPPNLGPASKNALVGSDSVIIPVESRYLATEGIIQLEETIEAVRKKLNPNLTVEGILACRFDGRLNHCKQIMEQLRNQFGDLMYQTVIRENVHLSEAPSFGKPILTYKENSFGSQDYQALAKEFLSRNENVPVLTKAVVN